MKKRIRKTKTGTKTSLYRYYLNTDGKICLAHSKDEIKGDLIEEPFATIYDFLFSRREYLLKDANKNSSLIKELDAYLAHVQSLIYRKPVIQTKDETQKRTPTKKVRRERK